MTSSPTILDCVGRGPQHSFPDKAGFINHVKTHWKSDPSCATIARNEAIASIKATDHHIYRFTRAELDRITDIISARVQTFDLEQILEVVGGIDQLMDDIEAIDVDATYNEAVTTLINGTIDKIIVNHSRVICNTIEVSNTTPSKCTIRTLSECNGIWQATQYLINFHYIIDVWQFDTLILHDVPLLMRSYAEAQLASSIKLPKDLVNIIRGFLYVDPVRMACDAIEQHPTVPVSITHSSIQWEFWSPGRYRTYHKGTW